jgi:WD40 repeat protein
LLLALGLSIGQSSPRSSPSARRNCWLAAPRRAAAAQRTMSYWGQQRALRKQWLGLVREVLEKQLDPQARRGLELIRSVLEEKEVAGVAPLTTRDKLTEIGSLMEQLVSRLQAAREEELQLERERAALRAASAIRLVDLPPDVLAHVLYCLPLAHDIARAATTCRVLRDAARVALKARPYSGEVVTLRHLACVYSVAMAPDGRIITGSARSAVSTLNHWRDDGTCERTIHYPTQAHALDVKAVAVLPGGARFVSGSGPACTAKLWALDGALERTFDMGSRVYCVAALPDGVHFVVGLGIAQHHPHHPCGVRLYHVDGMLVHTFKGGNVSGDVSGDMVKAVAVTHDGQHIISGSDWPQSLVKVWSVASKSLVSTCAGHTNTVDVVAAMPDGQRILSGSLDHTVRVWRLNGTPENEFRLHANAVTALVALPDCQHALSGSWDKTINLFNVNDGDILRTFTHHAQTVGAEHMCLALLPDGLRFVSGSSQRGFVYQHACIVYHGLAPQ